MKKRDTFTLVEMLLAVTILLILAGVGVPRLSDIIRRAEFSSYAQRVYALCDRARIQAFGANTAAAVVFDAAARELTVRLGDGPGSERIIARAPVPGDLTVSMEGDRLCFYPDNRPHAGALTITGRAGRSARIELKGLSVRLVYGQE